MAISACHQEPKIFFQAIKDPVWRETMDKEIQALEKIGTWILTPLPASKKPIGCKRVYKVKLNPNDTIERYTARLVAKGYTLLRYKFLGPNLVSPLTKKYTHKAINYFGPS